MQGCFKCSISPDETPIIVRASCPTAACSRDNSALVEYLTSYCSYTLYSIIYVTLLIVFVGHTLRNSFCKTSLMTDRLCPNWPHEQGGGIFICKTPRLFTQCTPERTSLLQRFTASSYTAGALKEIPNSTVSLGSY